jgi:hypothetical protein
LFRCSRYGTNENISTPLARNAQVAADGHQVRLACSPIGLGWLLIKLPSAFHPGIIAPHPVRGVLTVESPVQPLEQRRTSAGKAGNTAFSTPDHALLTMTTPTGQSYTAKLDGTEARYKGDPGTTSVSVKRTGKDSFEETDIRDGKVISVAQNTVSPDGKTMTVAVTDTLHGTTSKFEAKKQ